MRRLVGWLGLVMLAAVLGCGGGSGKVELPKNPTPPPPVPPVRAGEAPTNSTPAPPPQAR